MNCYQNYILPYFINGICSSSPITKQREKIVPLAKGEVLEIGIGSGLNLPFYDESKVNKIWGLEPYEGMRKLAEKKIKKTKLSDIAFQFDWKAMTPIYDKVMNSI